MMSKNIVFVLALFSSAGFSFASQKPHQPQVKIRIADTIGTKHDKEIADIARSLGNCKHESVEFPVLANKMATLLHNRIQELTDRLGKAKDPMQRLAFKTLIEVDREKLDSIHQVNLLHDLFKSVTAKPLSLNNELVLTYIATMELILEGQKKLITNSKPSFIDLATINKLLAECDAIKKPCIKVVEKENQKPANKKSEENLIKLIDVISTNNIKEIEECIKQCIEDNPDFFKQSLQLPKGNMNVLMLMLAHPTKKITKEALKLIVAHSEIHIHNALNDETLSMAIFKGNKDHVAVLLEAGAGVDGGLNPSDKCHPPLVRALEAGNNEITNMILGKVMMISDIVKKNNHLVEAAKWLQGNPRPNNTIWVEKLRKLGKNLIEKEIIATNLELARVVEEYAQHKKAQANQAALELDAKTKTDKIPEFTVAPTVITEKSEKRKQINEKAALEKTQKEAKKEKQREALERAKAKQRESERAAQSRLAIACLPAAGAGAGATQSSSSTPDETAQAIAQRKASARTARAQLKRGFMLEPATAVAPIATTALATKEGNLRNQLNPLLRPHLIKASELMPKNGRMAPLGIITAYLHNAPCQASASNSK